MKNSNQNIKNNQTSNHLSRFIASGVLAGLLISPNIAYSGNDDTLDYADIENPWVHFESEIIHWSEFNDDIGLLNGDEYILYSKTRGEGVDNILDWTSGSFFENSTNRERYIQRYVNDFDLMDFNAEAGENWQQDETKEAHIFLYNNASFTMGRIGVWVQYENDQGDTSEVQIYESDGDVVEEEGKDIMAMLPSTATRIRVGYKAKGEISYWPFNGYNWKHCDWVELSDDITGAVYKGDGLLYDKKCSLEFSDSAKAVFKGNMGSNIELDDNTVTLAFDQMQSTPAVFVTPPTYVGTAPGVVRLSNVNAQGFNMEFAEWNYLDGGHAIETVDYLALPEGSYEMPDGSVWEVGSFEISGNKTFKNISFSDSFSEAPYLFLTMQTLNGTDTVAVRAKSITASGFDAALFEEDALSDGHAVERVSYLAITTVNQNGTGSGFTYNNLDIDDYVLESVEITDDGVTVGGYTFYNQEEASADTETSHVNETIHVLAINGMTFAQQVSNNGGDTTSLRKVANETSTIILDLCDFPLLMSPDKFERECM